MSLQLLKGRSVKLDVAREISKNVGSNIIWRPDPRVHEENQYCIILDEGEEIAYEKALGANF